VGHSASEGLAVRPEIRPTAQSPLCTMAALALLCRLPRQRAELGEPAYVAAGGLWPASAGGLGGDALADEPLYLGPSPCPGFEESTLLDNPRIAVATNMVVRPGPRFPRRRKCRVLMAERLSELQSEDTACVIYVGYINRLGFESAELLREHYERYGQVVKVLLPNAHERSEDGPFPQRVRPSHVGFVLMEKPEDAARAIAAGATQIVSGVPVLVRKFEPRAPPPEEAGEAGEGPEVAEEAANAADCSG